MADFHVVAGSDGTLIHPTVRQIGPHDLKEALRKGVDDFKAMPTHLAFIGLIYPLFGIGLAALTFTENALPLLFPLVSGFALLGPIAAIGLYELSRRRELGLDTSWDHLFDVLRSPSLPSILALGRAADGHLRGLARDRPGALPMAVWSARAAILHGVPVRRSSPPRAAGR